MYDTSIQVAMFSNRITVFFFKIGDVHEIWNVICIYKCTNNEMERQIKHVGPS